MHSEFGWYTSAKAKYGRETDSEQVPWGKDEKNFGKKVKRAWNYQKGSETISSRLETRTKESNRFVSLRGVQNQTQEGVAKASLLRVAWTNLLGPDRWWTIVVQGEAERKFGGSSKRCWRANRSWEMTIGAKDQSNHLVAGSLRNFSQDSCSSALPVTGAKKTLVRFGRAND